jgi:hypothetical protein
MLGEDLDNMMMRSSESSKSPQTSRSSSENIQQNGGHLRQQSITSTTSNYDA